MLVNPDSLREVARSMREAAAEVEALATGEMAGVVGDEILARGAGDFDNAWLTERQVLFDDFVTIATGLARAADHLATADQNVNQALTASVISPFSRRHGGHPVA